MTTPTPRAKPWRTRTIRRPRPDVVAIGAQPIAQLIIYEDLVLYTRREGGMFRQYPVAPEAIAHALSNVPSVTGLLPEGALGAGLVAGRPFLVLHVPPHRATLHLADGTDYTLPLPPLIIAGCGDDYRIWALATSERPTETTPLMVAPFPNCYDSGAICWGSSDARRPASAASLLPTLTLFLEGSQFNLHLANGKSRAFPTSVIAQWQALVTAGAEVYPLDDLVAAESTLGAVLSGRIWGGAR